MLNAYQCISCICINHVVDPIKNSVTSLQRHHSLGLKRMFAGSELSTFSDFSSLKTAEGSVYVSCPRGRGNASATSATKSTLKPCGVCREKKRVPSLQVLVKNFGTPARARANAAHPFGLEKSLWCVMDHPDEWENALCGHRHSPKLLTKSLQWWTLQHQKPSWNDRCWSFLARLKARLQFLPTLGVTLRRCDREEGREKKRCFLAKHSDTPEPKMAGGLQTPYGNFDRSQPWAEVE